MNDTTFKLRLPANELQQWREQASHSNQSLAAWIRSRCKIAEPTEALEPPPSPQKIKTCPHGIEEGWRCSLCGCIVK